MSEAFSDMSQGEYWEYYRQLNEEFPDRCKNELDGQPCNQISGKTVNIADDVDHGVITPEQGIASAKEAAEQFAKECKYGQGNKSGLRRKCGYGVLCHLGAEW